MNNPINHQKASILIIEDEKDVLKALADLLTAEYFTVHKAATGHQGIQLAKEYKPDVIILDLRLPDIDGFDVCRELKNQTGTSTIPIIILSTRGQETEKVVGLEIGADDYIVKPYSSLELLARIRVVLRRKNNQPFHEPSTQGILNSQHVFLDTEARLVKVDKKNVHLTRKEFELLALLMSRPGKALSRAQIMDMVWGESLESMQSTVDSHIKTLRKKLGDDGKLIETVSGIGYRWAD